MIAKQANGTEYNISNDIADHKQNIQQTNTHTHTKNVCNKIVPTNCAMWKGKKKNKLSIYVLHYSQYGIDVVT